MGDKIQFNERYKMLIEEYGEVMVLKSIGYLNDKCKMIVNMYFGLNGENKKSLYEINEIMNIKDSNKWMYYSLQRMKQLIDRNFKNNSSNNMTNISNKKLIFTYLTTKDKNICDQIINNNFELINKCIVKTVEIPYMSEEEIIEEFFGVGCIGLHNAINTFTIEKSKEISFNVYAKKCICEELVKAKKNYLDNVVSLDEVIQYNLESDEDGIESIIENDYKKYVNKTINEALSTRSPKTKLIMEHYYGLNGKEVITEKEISEKYNISYAFIKSIIYKTNRYLKRVLESKNNKKIR